MALQIDTPSSFPHKPYYSHLPCTPFFLLTQPSFAVRTQKLIVDSEPAAEPSPPKKAAAPGQGFGSSSSASSQPGKSPKRQKSKRERASVIRRSPVEEPDFLSKEEEVIFEEQRRTESAFLLAWLGLGGIILVEGIVLAASGFLPQDWDKFFVKYLYPPFTPTVVLFIAGKLHMEYSSTSKMRNLKSKNNST